MTEYLNNLCLFILQSNLSRGKLSSTGPAYNSVILNRIYLIKLDKYLKILIKTKKAPSLLK